MANENKTGYKIILIPPGFNVYGPDGRILSSGDTIYNFTKLTIKRIGN